MRQTGFLAPVTLAAQEELVSPLILLIDRKYYHGAFKFTVKVADAARTFSLARSIEFMGPDANLLTEDDHEKHRQR